VFATPTKGLGTFWLSAVEWAVAESTMVDLHHLAETALPEVFEKWGFGMAPPKRETQTSRELWARTVIKAIVDPAARPWPQDVLEAISGVKGMFMRIFRMDQWDWFTVYTQLGHPSRGLAKTIGEALADMRMAARDGDENGLRQAQKHLSELPARRCLRFFLGELAVPEEKLWGGRRRLWHLHRPYEPKEVAPWPKSMISAEA
jgi:hypothetical protein